MMINKRALGFHAATIAVLALYAFEARREGARIDSVFDALDAAIHEHKVGAGAGPQFTGKQFIEGFGTLHQVYFEDKPVPANTPTIVYTFPAPAANELHTYEATTKLRYQYEVEAGAACNGAQCVATIWRYTSGEYKTGSTWCRDADNTCATSSATAIDFAGPNMVNDAGPMGGCTAPIVWTGAALAIQVTCPVAVVASGTASGDHDKDPSGFDAGPIDAGPAAITSITPNNGSTGGGTSATILMTHGATGGCATKPTLAGVTVSTCSVTDDLHLAVTSAAGSAGTGDVVVTSPACSPTCTLTNGWTYNTGAAITAVHPNFVSAAGGQSIEITCTSCSTMTTVAAGALGNLGSATYHASGCTYGGTCVTGTAPAHTSTSGSAGTATPLTLNTSGAGTATTSTNQTSLLYGSSLMTDVWLGDVSATSTTWTPYIGSDTWSGTDTLSANFNGTGLQALSFDGSSQHMTMTLGTPPSGGAFASCMVAQVTTLGGTTQLLHMWQTVAGTGGWYPDINTSNHFLWVFGGGGSHDFGAFDTNPHVICINAISGFTNANVDSTEYSASTGSLNPVNLTNGLGSSAVANSFASVKIAAFVYFNQSLTTATDFHKTADALAVRYGITAPW